MEGVNLSQLFESKRWIVIHMEYQVGDAQVNAFELVERLGTEDADVVFLHGEPARGFEGHIQRWKANTPTQEQVEEVIEQFCRLGRTPVHRH